MTKIRSIPRIAVAAFGLLTLATTAALSAGDTPQRGGTLIIGVPNTQKNLNSAIYHRTMSGQLISINLFDGLLRISKFGDGKFTPVLAKSWDISADGLTYTLHLRDDVKWHDGKPFTSADVKFSIMEVSRPHHATGRSNFNAIKSFETPDPYTAVIKLDKADASFLGKLDPKWCSIAPKHILEGTDIPKNDYNWAPIATGPFKFKEWVRGSHIIFEKNENYWGKAANGDRLPYLDRLIFKIIPNKSTLLSSLQAGEIDFIHSFPSVIPPSEVARLNKSGTGITVAPFAYANKAFDFIFFNTQRKITGDVNVRRAIAHLVNTDEIIDKVFGGLAKSVRSKDSGFMTWYTETVPKNYYPYDRKKAQEILDEAGYKKGADGKRFTLNMTLNQRDAHVLKLVDIMRTDFKAAGIGLDVKVYDVSTNVEKVHKNLDYDLHVTTIATGPDPDVLTKTWHSSNIGKGFNNNSSGYKNQKVDTMLEKGRLILNPKKRQAWYADLQEILMADIPMLPITEALWLHTFRDNVGGFPIGYTFRDGLEAVHWKGEIPKDRR